MALRERLTRDRPDDAVLGEELGLTEGRGDGRRRWILDPLDSTRSFVHGHANWTVLIALERDGEVEVGVVAQPAHRRRWWATRGGGAWSADGRRLSVSAAARRGEARLCDDSRGNARWGPDDHPAAMLAVDCGSCRSPHDLPMHVVVAEGRAELALQRAAPWDFAPFAVIVEEAGGRFTDLDGGPRLDTGYALASNGLVHDQALEALRRY